MAIEKNDLLQKFIDNEKKSKKWTSIYAAVFMMLTLAIIYFAYQSSVTSARLDIALKKADSLNNINENNKSSLMNATKTADKLQHQYDSLLQKFAPAQLKIDTVKAYKKNYTVYIQYIAGYAEDSKRVLSLLQQQKYNTPGRELMKKETFWSCVKYFDDADKAQAQAVANIINKNIDRFATKPIRIVENRLNVPPGQLEVWLGEVQQLDTKQLIQKYDQQ